MNDVNYIKGQLQSWRACINWIDKEYPEKKFELEHERKNLKGINYEENTGGVLVDESMRRSIVNDKLNELKEDLNHRKKTIAECEKIVSQVKSEYQSVFEYRYKYLLDVPVVAGKTIYSESRIYEILSEEIKRIATK